MYYLFVVFFKQKTAYEMRISDWSSDVCSSDLLDDLADRRRIQHRQHRRDQRVLGLVRAVRRLAAVIVAGDREKAAVRRCAFEIAELPRFAGTIDADALAVPQAVDAFELRFADRKSVVLGQSVSVSVDLGGCRRLTKKKKKKH